jgi:hypothetical protein
MSRQTLARLTPAFQYYTAVAREKAVFVIVSIVLFGFIAALSLRTAVLETIQGRIEVIRIVPSDEGATLNAFVRLKDGSLISVRLPRQFNCKPGRRIAIQKSRVLFGYRYNSLPDACL